MAVGAGAGTAWVAVKPNMAGFSRDVSRGATKGGQTAGSSFSQGFKNKLKVGAAIGGAFAVAAGGKFLKDSINEASNAQQSIGATEQIFKQFANTVIKRSKDAANAIGVSANEYRELANVTGAMLKNSGMPLRKVTDLTDKLNVRAADMAATFGGTTKEAVEAVSSLLRGEADPIERYGVSIKQSDVNARLAAKGLDKLEGSAKKQAEMQARLDILFQQTADSQGQFSRESGTLAGAQQRLSANWKDMQAQVGAKLLPALARLSDWGVRVGIPMLKNFGAWIRENKDTILLFAGALATVVIAQKAYKVATAIATAWTNRQAIAQSLLNRAMMLNPIGLIVGALVLLVGAFVIAYKKSDTFRRIVDNAWTKIKAAVKVAWERVIKPALSAMWTFIQKRLVPAIQWLWSKVVKPVFGFIGKAIKFWWNNIVKPAFKALWWYLSSVIFPVLRFLWNKVVKPVFKGIGATIKWAWNNVIRPAFDALRTGVGKVKDAFETAKNGIKRVWNALKAIVKAPIKAVVWLINKGLIAPFNFVSGKLGGPTIDPIKLPKGFRRGGWTGPGGERDAAGVVHADEFVIRKSSRRKFERQHPGALDELNNHGRLPGFFLGGHVPMAGMTSAKKHSGYSGTTWAGDLNGSGDDTGKSVLAWKDGIISDVISMAGSYGNHIKMNHIGAQTLYAHLSRFSASVGQGIKAGQKIGEVGSTGNSTGPHLHFELKGGNSPIGDFSSGIASPAASIRSMLGGLNPAEYLRDKFSLDGLAKFGNSALMKMIKAAPTKLLGAAIDKVKSLASSFTSGSGAYATNIDPNALVGGAKGPQAYAKALLPSYGWGPGQFKPLFDLWMRESGWRWNADNPTSSAYGIPQALPGSKMASAGADWRTNPLTQVRWGLGYIKDRYGSPAGAWAHSQAHNWYDKGGQLPPGLSAVMNGTGRTEAVLTAQQWQDISSLARRGSDMSGAQFVLRVPGMGDLMTEVVRIEQDADRRHYQELSRR